MLVLYLWYLLHPSAMFQARINPSNISDIQISCIKDVGNYQRHWKEREFLLFLSAWSTEGKAQWIHADYLTTFLLLFKVMSLLAYCNAPHSLKIHRNESKVIILTNSKGQKNTHEAELSFSSLSRHACNQHTTKKTTLEQQVYLSAT